MQFHNELALILVVNYQKENPEFANFGFLIFVKLS